MLVSQMTETSLKNLCTSSLRNRNETSPTLSYFSLFLQYPTQRAVSSLRFQLNLTVIASYSIGQFSLRRRVEKTEESEEAREDK